MEKHIIEEINIKPQKDGISKKTNKPYTFYPIGLKIKGEWYNQNLFNIDQVDKLRKIKTGNEIECRLYNDEYDGKIFKRFELPKPPNKQDLLLEKINNLEIKIDRIIKGTEELYRTVKKI